MISFKFYKLDLKLLGFLKSGANMFKFTRHTVSLFLIGQKNESFFTEIQELFSKQQTEVK